MCFSKPILQTAQNKKTLAQISLMTLLVQILKVCQMTHWKPLIMELSLMLPRRQRSRTGKVCVRWWSNSFASEPQCWLKSNVFLLYLLFSIFFPQVVENVLHFFGVFVFGADTFTVNMNMHDLLYDNVIT